MKRIPRLRDSTSNECYEHLSSPIALISIFQNSSLRSCYTPTTHNLHFPHPVKMPSITTDQWLEAAAYRRTIYGVAGTSKVSDERVEEIVSKVLSFAPSSYNTQPVRISLAFGEKHKELWSVIIKEAEPVLKSMSLDLWEKFGPILESHKSAYGSVCRQLS